MNNPDTAVKARPLPDPELFWAKVDRANNIEECWEWTGYTDRDGYGCLEQKGVHWRAHRAAYELTVGPIPPGLHLLHSCDNPPCCNPHHHSPGTPKQNADDRLRRNRDATLARARQEAAGQLSLLETLTR